jgi:hypothetical protein
LLNPTVGDLVDRLTILALKRLHGAAAGRDIAHFQREWAGLLAKIHGRSLNGAWFEHALDLAAVNAQLWDLTNDLRRQAERHSYPDEVIGVRALLVDQIAHLGMDILRANDARARLIRTIDELCGEFAGAEKL